MTDLALQADDAERRRNSKKRSTEDDADAVARLGWEEIERLTGLSSEDLQRYEPEELGLDVVTEEMEGA